MQAGGSRADPLDAPVPVEAAPESEQCKVELCEGTETLQPEQPLSRTSVEAPGAAAAPPGTEGMLP